MSLGVHVLYATEAARAVARTADVVKVIGPWSTHVLHDAKPGATTIYRHHWTPTNQDGLLAAGRDGAHRAVMVIHDELRRQDAHPTYIESLNETHQRLAAGLEAHIAWLRHFTEFAHALGYQVIGFNFSTGGVEYPDLEACVYAGWAGVDVVGIREYWGQGFDHRGRTINLIRAAAENAGRAVPRIFVGECGRDTVGAGPRLGWRAQGVTAEYFARELADYAAACAALDIHVTPYTWGANYGGGPQPWDSFDLDGLEPASPKAAAV